jgi:hypothetical protein
MPAPAAAADVDLGQVDLRPVGETRKSQQASMTTPAPSTVRFGQAMTSTGTGGSR